MLKQNTNSKNTQNFIGKILAKLPISPNQWTLLSVILALFAGVFIASYNLWLGLALFAVSAFCDLADGAVAREKGLTSKLGGFIDGVADRFVEAIFLFSFMFYPLPVVFIDPKIWISFLLFFGAAMPSFIRAYADHKEIISTDEALALGGICERSERLIILIIGLAISIILSNMTYFLYAIILAFGLSIITIVQRLLKIFSLAKS